MRPSTSLFKTIRQVDGYDVAMNRLQLQRRCVGYTALIAAAFVLADAQKNAAQTTVPPAASLDVQVPAAPIPVKIEGRSHLAYELHLTNYRTVELSLSRLDVMDANRHLLASYEGNDLSAQMTRVGARAGQSDGLTIGPGMSAILFLWLTLEDKVPETIHHRISYDLTGSTKDGNQSATIEAAPVRVGNNSAVVLGPPLRGGPWTALYGPSIPRGHRRTLFAIEGRARIPARFAIDWVKLGPDGRPYHGDRSVPQNYYGYGADVLAVDDGVVASVVDRYPEPTVPITLENESGNFLAFDLGAGRFALYEHLQPGSIRVKLGDRVRGGQALARVGASGSVFSGPHLHFHVSDGTTPLGAEGLPFVFRRFEVLGAFSPNDFFDDGKPWRVSGTPALRQMEMPAPNSVLRF
jgi:murein DD-endopeptidase MepM/ murein hydrolase activator NlpD